MKLLIVIIVALLAGTSLIWQASIDPGFVLLKYGGHTLQMSLVIFAILLGLLLLVVYLILRGISLTKRAPKKFANWQNTRRHQRAGQVLIRGLISLEEGRWAEAERLLARHAGNSETPLLHYLAAARAAQKQGAFERRDEYLRLAHDTTAGANIAVGVVQAELQLDADQKEQALATLQHLREVSPKHRHVLHLLQKLYTNMNQWENVQDVLPDLYKRHVLPSVEVKALSVAAAAGQMQAALERGDWTAMQSLWQQASAKIKKSEAMIAIYTLGLEQHHFVEQAQLLIENYLDKDWSDRLVYQYGKIVQADSLPQLAKAEKWLKNRQDNPWLLLTAGSLAASNTLWAKAEQYLYASIQHGECGEAYQVLAKVLAENGKEDQAVDVYQKGLDLALMQNDGQYKAITMEI